MSYAPPAGHSVEIGLPHIAYSPAHGAAAQISLLTYASGVGDVKTVVFAAGVGVRGTSGGGAEVVQFQMAGVAEQPPTGVGAYRFADSFGAGAGYVATFGSAVAQVRLSKSGAGKAAVMGQASAVVISATATGGGRVAGAGVVAIQLTVAATGSTLPAEVYTQGKGVARLLLSGAGAGITARVATGSAKVLCAGAGQGARGVEGAGTLPLIFQTTSDAGRGAVAGGAASFALKGRGAGGRGVAGAASAPFMHALGFGLVRPMFFGVGLGNIALRGLGRGEGFLDYDDSDATFLRSVQQNVFVLTLQ